MPVQRYRAVLFVSIVTNVVSAVVFLLWPDVLPNALNQPEVFPKTWPRYVGAELLAINFLYLPGYWDPQTHQWPNWCGIVIRLTVALFFFSQGGGFIPMGIADGLFGLALLVTYLPVVRATARTT
jgi:hypothetical protein